MDCGLSEIHSACISGGSVSTERDFVGVLSVG